MSPARRGRDEAGPERRPRSGDSGRREAWEPEARNPENGWEGRVVNGSVPISGPHVLGAAGVSGPGEGAHKILL